MHSHTCPVQGLTLRGQRYPREALHVTRGSLTLAGHKNYYGWLKGHAPRLLRGWADAPVHIQYSATVWWHNARVHAWGLLKGRRVPGLPYQHTRPLVCAWLTIVALGEGLQASVSCSGWPQPGHGSLTSQPSPRYPSLENLTILQCSTAFSRNLIHVATMREGAALLSYLISKSCYVPNAEVNPLLSPWTRGSQKSCSSWSLNFHKHPPLTRKSCLTTKLRGITCRPLSSTAVSP